MQFILNDKTVTELEQPADMTILKYLREHQGLSGTKEGCASGDCGACTILLGQLTDTGSGTKTVKYQSVNACIATLGSVQGKHLVTVEYLSKAGHLHPAQTAMVQNHGSQCGFCTPGFVMSLAGLYENQNGNAVTREQVCDAISGNLCRCTGYRPIIDAGLKMHEVEEGANHLSDASSLQTSLSQLDSDAPSSNYFKPNSIDELCKYFTRYPDATLIAGGTDLMLEVTQRFDTFTQLIDLSGVSELTEIREDEDYLWIGGAVTYTQMEIELSERFPELVAMMHRVASRQIRNRGTLGGNLANGSPIADLPPILLAMDAELVLTNNNGDNRSVAIDEFYEGYKQTALQKNEFIETVKVPRSAIDAFHRFYKISKRMEDDISSVFIAVRLDMNQEGTIQHARIAFGGIAATPVRISAAEGSLVGNNINDTSSWTQAEQALRAHIKPLSDVRASAAYRTDMAANLLLKILHQANAEPMPNLTHADETGGFYHA